MRITITGRHIKITTALKAHIEEKLKKLEKFAIKITDLHVILTVERDRHIAELLLVAKKLSLSSKTETQDMYTSFDSALGLLEERIAKYMDKRKTRRLRLLKEKSETLKPSGKRLMREDRYELKPMSVEEAMAQLEVSDNNFLIFNDRRGGRVNVIYKRKDGDIGIIETG